MRQLQRRDLVPAETPSKRRRRPLGRPGQSLLLMVAGLARRGPRKNIKAHPRIILLTRHTGPLTSSTRCRLAGPSSSVGAPRRCHQQPTAGGANTVPPADHRISRMTTPANPGPPAHARPVLVTGATGLPGSMITAGLLATGSDALGLARHRERAAQNRVNLRSATGHNSMTRSRAESAI
jgi:hypothetical protein